MYVYYKTLYWSMFSQDMTIYTAVLGPMVWGEEAEKVFYISDLLLKQVLYVFSYTVNGVFSCIISQFLLMCCVPFVL